MTTRNGGIEDLYANALDEPPHRDGKSIKRLWISLGFTIPLIILSLEPLIVDSIPFSVLGTFGILPFAIIQALLFAPVALANRSAFKHILPGLGALVAFCSVTAAGSGIVGTAFIATGTAIGDPLIMQTGSSGLLFGPAALALSFAGFERTMRGARDTKNFKPDLTNHISRLLLPTAIGVAGATCAFGLIIGRSIGISIFASIAVLALFCPCALCLASTLVALRGTLVGLRSGILVKSPSAFERASSIDTVVVDKIGALTEAKPTVTDIVRMSDMDDNDLLSLAATIQTRSEFPLAKAIVAEAAKSGLPIGEVEGFKFHPGKGVEATIKGKRYFAGGPELLMENGIDVRAALGRIIPFTAQGKTPFSFGSEGKMLGLIVVADPIRPTSRAAIATMRKMGLDVIMLTADNHPTAKGIGEALGISRFYAGLLPGNKTEIIRDLKKEGRAIMMVGDGQSDAPALAEADVGVAIGAGADIAIGSADFTLINGDLRDAVAGIALGRAVSRITRQNLFLSLALSALAIPYASGALTPSVNPASIPSIAVCAMLLGLAAVALNTCRIGLIRRG